jgi:uncharacterized protein (TIGR02391 family)
LPTSAVNNKGRYHALVEIRDLVPDPEALLSLEVEELAGVLLMHLNSGSGELHHYNFFNNIRNYPVYGDQVPPRAEKVNRALMEAWDWLLYEGFLAKKGDDDTRAGTFVTRRGQRVKSQEDFAAYRKNNLLPKGQLHPLIASRVYPAFLRGEYDTAIFQAFREVEVAVRTAGAFSASDCGVELMRAAFRVSKNSAPPGPLTDAMLPPGEQEAMGHLFAGALGVYRNSTGHRHVPTDAEEAAEVIMLASQLLRIVDRLSPPQAVTDQS